MSLRSMGVWNSWSTVWSIMEGRIGPELVPVMLPDTALTIPVRMQSING